MDLQIKYCKINISCGDQKGLYYSAGKHYDELPYGYPGKNYNGVSDNLLH